MSLSGESAGLELDNHTVQGMTFSSTISLNSKRTIHYQTSTKELEQFLGVIIIIIPNRQSSTARYIRYFQ